MISFTLLTDTPVRLRNQLIARGIIKQDVDEHGNPALVGVRPGVEWIEVPNPIVTTMPVGPRMLPNPDYVPAVGEPFITNPTPPPRSIPNPDYVPAVGSPTLGPNPDYVPAVMDPRHVYLVKVAWDAEDNETDGLQQDDVDPDTGRRTIKSVLARTRFGQWIMANSVPETITSATGQSWQSRNINNNFWLIPDTADFGVWQ